MAKGRIHADHKICLHQDSGRVGEILQLVAKSQDFRAAPTAFQIRGCRAGLQVEPADTRDLK